jgi:predicted AAA+ superfamily ATPase
MTADLEGFLAANPRRVAIDEAQRTPELFPVLRHVVDRTGGRGRFVLLGSASPALIATASETLAGRIGFLELTPFLASELVGTPFARDRWFWGGYPPVLGLRDARARAEWLESYVSTFLERELPLLGLRLPAPRLRTLWTMLTHVHGHLLNVSDLARSLTVSAHTVNDHLDVLEATFMVRRLQPYHANVQKRLTKSAKIYIRDSGLLHLLAGLRRLSDLDARPRRGHSFEGLVVEELAMLASERMVRPQVFFWRTQAGAEVDLLIVDGRRVLPIEVKLGTAVGRHDVAGLKQCMKDLSLKQGWVVYTGTERRSLGREIELVPWTDVTRGKGPF